MPFGEYFQSVNVLQELHLGIALEFLFPYPQLKKKKIDYFSFSLRTHQVTKKLTNEQLK
jgi:hypothetical protein